MPTPAEAASGKANGKEPESCFGRQFNFKLDRFAIVEVFRG
jgi:hypothetical protein